MNNLNNSLEVFSDLNSFENRLNVLTPSIKKFGGRCFIVRGESKSLTMNGLVKELCAITQRQTKIDKRQLNRIIASIKELDKKGDQKLSRENIYIKIATALRQFFGNLSFNRTQKLIDLQLMAALKPDVGPSPLYLKNHINSFVEKFLFPYISGQIGEEERTSDRKPMIDQLLADISNTYSTSIDDASRSEIEKMALQAYFDVAAKGLYINLKVSDGVIPPCAAQFKVLLNALREAIPKDFPSIDLNDSQLKYKAESALLIENDRRIANIKPLRKLNVSKSMRNRNIPKAIQNFDLWL